MNIKHPVRLMILGGFLAFFGMCIAFIMVLRVVESTFLLNFVAYICSMLGLLFGILGVVEYNSRQDRWD